MYRTRVPKVLHALACTLIFAASACGDSGGGTPGTSGAVEGVVTLTGATDHGGVRVMVDQTGDVAISATDGRFRLPYLAAGQITLTASRAGYISATSGTLTVEAGKTTQAGTLELAPVQGAITGTALKEGETDQSGIVVRIVGTMEEVVTGSDGTFSFDSVAAGTQMVEAQSDGFETARSMPLTVMGDTPVDAGTLVLARSRGSLTGMATLEGETDHSGILVSLVGTAYATLTGPTGAYTFSGIPVGQYTVQAARTSFASASAADQTVEAGQTTSVPALVLARNPGTVTGLVTLEGGGDPTGTSVTLVGTGITAVAGSDGAFTLANAPAGTYMVQATLTGYDPAQSAPFVLAPGGTFDVGTLTLPLARGSLSGSAFLDGQTDHSGILVSVMGTGYAAMTGTSGSWSILGVPAGNYTIRASRSGFEDASATDQQVSAGQNTAVPNITLYVRTSSISGTVTLESTTDHSGVSIVATASWNPALTRSGSSNSAGAYTITGVEPGMWHVVASKTDYQSATQENVFVQADYPTVGIDFMLEYRPSGVPSDLVYVSGGSNDADPNQTGVVFTELSAPFVVKVLDAYGAPVPGTQVYFEVIDAQSGGHMVNPVFVLTNAQGEASNTYVLGQTVGLNHVRAGATYVPGQFVNFLAMGEPDVPDAVLPQHGDLQTATVGTTLPTTLGVLVHDQYGNAVPGMSCTFVPPVGSASPPSVVTDSLGYAQSIWTLGTTMGLQTLTATCGTATYVFNATALHDVAATIVKLSGDNQTGINSTTLTSPLVVEVRDQYGNPASGSQVSFAVTTGSGTLNPSTPQTTGPSGRAQTSLTLSSLGSIQVTASITGLTPAVFSATSIAGTPSVLVLVSGGGQQGVVATTLAAPFVVRLNDNFGNPVEGATLHFAAGASAGAPGSVNIASAVTVVTGQASTTLTLGTLAGAAAQWVDISVDGFPTVTLRITADAEPDEPASIAIVSGDNQTAAYGQQLAEPLVVYVEDQYGNPVLDYQTTWASTTEGTVFPNLSPTDAGGRATVTATLGSTPGTPAQNFTATAGSVNVTFDATATEHWIQWMDPGRTWPGCTFDIEIEIRGGGFDVDAIVIWDAGGLEQPVVPSLIEPGRLLVTLTADLFDLPGDFPITIEQVVGGRCATFIFRVGPVLPDTGQTLCYSNTAVIPCPAQGEEYYGEDAQFGWDLILTSDIRFERTEPMADEPVVFDQLTQLEWQGCIAGLRGSDCSAGEVANLTWQSALDYCNSLDWAGHADWRPPTPHELTTLFHWDKTTIPYMYVSVFPGTPIYPRVWTSLLSQWSTYSAWLVSFESLDYPIKTDGKNGFARALCVRGSMDASDRFTVWIASGQRIVRDEASSLMWQGCPAGLEGENCDVGSRLQTTWKEALAYCTGLTWGGFDDWRLPSVLEVQSMVDYQRYAPPVDSDVFPGMGAYTHWTSTTRSLGANRAFHLTLSGGEVGQAYKYVDTLGLQCVRGLLGP